MKPIRAQDLLRLDKNLEVTVLDKYPIPEQVVYQAAKCDYSETPIHHQQIPPPSECGKWVVDSLLSNERGHYGCYSSDTQVLTDNGWVHWPNVTKTTFLAAYDTKAHTIQFEIPSAIQNWDYEGKMYSLKSKIDICRDGRYYFENFIDLLVSPDHRIIFSDTKDGLDNYKILTAEEFYNLNKDAPGVNIPHSSGGVYSITNPKEEWVNYKGTIHCATVSTGALIVRRNKSSGIVCGNCLEHPQITFSTSGYVHNVMVQARTHRIGTSWDCQSQRYTGKRVVKVANQELKPEDVFYVRPPGFYTNRKGKKYDWTEEDYQDELKFILEGCKRYAIKYERGMCEEHIRDYLAQAIRQNFVVSFNLRSVLHFMDLRAKMDAQLEIQALCDQIAPHLQDWSPHVWEYYKEKRLYKARLSP